MTHPAAASVRARNLAADSDNKIHDDDVAQRFGFRGALVPGVEVFAYATRPFVSAWGLEFLRGGTMDIRFRRPVYDGDLVTTTPAVVGGGWSFEVAGDDGEVRARGHATLGTAAVPAGGGGAPDLPAAVVPDIPPPASAESLSPGTALGSVVEVASAEGCADYLGGIGETLPLYASEGVVHPGLLLRMVNAALFRSVALGPWIHTASTCRFLSVARVGAELSCRAVVRDLTSRNGNDYVHYDAVVLADDVPVMVVDHEAIYQLG